MGLGVTAGVLEAAGAAADSCFDGDGDEVPRLAFCDESWTELGVGRTVEGAGADTRCSFG